MHGGLPSFILRARFDREIIANVKDHEISDAIMRFVPSEIERGGTVEPELLGLYGTVDWQSDSNNGSLNQYFARRRDPYGGLDRSLLYPATLKGLELIGHAPAAKLFRESISTYSHFHPWVENVREQLGIPKISSPDDSNVVSEYWDVEETLDQLRTAYVRKNIDQLAGR